MTNPMTPLRQDMSRHDHVQSVAADNTCNLSLRIRAAVVARKLATPYPTASDKLFRDVCNWGAHRLAPRPFAISWHNA